MIPEELRDSIPLYVLGELDDAGRATFEVQLSRSAELQQEVRNCADSFAALAHDPNAPRELPAHIWAAVEQRVRQPEAGAVGAGIDLPPLAPVESRRVVWWQVAWPAAAALLFAMNLAQWFWPRGTDGRAENAFRPAVTQQGGPSAQPEFYADGLRGTAGATARSGNSTTSGAIGRPQPIPAGTVDELSEARQRAQRLAADYRKLAGEYDELARTVLPFVNSELLDSQRSPIWAVELRSAVATAGVSTGLWDRARSLVPETGLALLPDRWRFSSMDAAEGAGVDRGPAFGTTTDPEETPAAPFAMAALNSEEGLGYLDLYNLPAVPENASMQLWLQSAGEAGYTPVGAVPPVLGGGSGGLVFRIPPEAGGAARILITIERGNTPAQPSGPVVIQGP